MKTGEFYTLIRSYRGVICNMQVDDIWITFDAAYYNYFAEDDEIQFLLYGQGGVVSIHGVVDYEKIPEDELLEDTVAGFDVRLKNGRTLSVFMMATKN